MFFVPLLLIALPAAEPMPLVRGQEFVYRGRCERVARGEKVDETTVWNVETRLFVVDVSPRGAEVALLTSTREMIDGEAGPATARLTMLNVAPDRRVVSLGQAFHIPLETLAPLDPIAFVENIGELSAGQSWETPDGDRPPRTWRVVGVESLPTGGWRGWKLVGEQRTARFDVLGIHRAWRRLDTAWVDGRSGLVRRLERVIDRRDPHAAATVTRVTVTHELDSQLTYPGRSDAEIRGDIGIAWQVERGIHERMTSGTRDPRAFDGLARRLANHLKIQPPSVYREAVLASERHLEQARRGEWQPIVFVEESAPPVAVGEPLPRATATELTGGRSRLIGKVPGQFSILVVFSPGSPTAEESLKAVENLSKQDVPCHALALGDPAGALALVQKLKLTMPCLDGREARGRLAPESTPRFLVVDGNGTIRELIDGWGPEVPKLLAEAVGKAG